MSDVNADTKEKQFELYKTLRDMRFCIIFGSIGFILLVLRGPLSGESQLHGLYSILLVLLAIFIAGIPGLISQLKLGVDKNWKHYEVITTTTDSAGNVLNKKSDHGAQSKDSMNIAMIVFGCVITAVKCFYLPFKYIKCHLAMNKKPPFVKSGFPWIIYGVLVLFIVPGIASSIKSAKYNADVSAFNAGESHTMSVPSENGYPMEISAIRYRDDAIIIVLTETKKGAAMPFIFTGYPNSRLDNMGRINPSFDITTASGTYSTGYGAYYNGRKYDTRSLADAKGDAYIGLQLEFPLFEDKVFSMKETSTTDEIKDLLVFTNVTVNK